jgi:hypothetical protein
MYFAPEICIYERGGNTEMGKRKIFSVELAVIPEGLIVLIHIQAKYI